MVGQWISALLGLCWMPGLHGHLGLPAVCTGLAEALGACMLALVFVLPWISGCPALAWIWCCRACACDLDCLAAAHWSPARLFWLWLQRSPGFFASSLALGRFCTCSAGCRTSLRTPWTSDLGSVHACTGFWAAVTYACTGVGLPFTRLLLVPCGCTSLWWVRLLCACTGHCAAVCLAWIGATLHSMPAPARQRLLQSACFCASRSALILWLGSAPAPLVLALDIGFRYACTGCWLALQRACTFAERD